ncbi:hypothetical protein [Burkholderia sp. BCC0405]|uniref:hypothetical protein n=1 Tax=Burkholderia sp. BCC0405 TaxID=2676298 RepID=UPI00158A21BD|nr:hypothetical protein [Burkholderia sp. BCC0405]
MTLLVLYAVGQDYYCFAVYCLATSFLINWCPDQTNQTYFADLRKTWDITGFIGGTVASSADVSTSESLNVPEFLNGLQLSNLQQLKDPYGRQWLGMQQPLGNIWGVS